MMNEQPFVDVTVMECVHVTEKELSEFETEKNLTATSSQIPKEITSDTTVGRTSTLAPIGPKPKNYTSGDDVLMGHMEDIKAKFKALEESKTEETEKGTPTMEKDLSLISSYPPPTWSMLQETDIIKSCNPVIVASTPVKPDAKKKTTGKAGKVADAIRLHVDLSRQTTTPDSFKPRPTLSSTDQGKPFVLSKGTGKEPSMVGRDDTMKSSSEVQMEYANRKMWESKGTKSYTGTETASSKSSKKGAKK